LLGFEKKINDSKQMVLSAQCQNTMSVSVKKRMANSPGHCSSKLDASGKRCQLFNTSNEKGVFVVPNGRFLVQ
jgi:hypothetical protein